MALVLWLSYDAAQKLTFPFFLYLLFIINLQVRGGESKLFQLTSLVVSCKAGLLKL